ncbi:hypothetical protein VOLCADRAFT_93769 [Volvox carteri f. nagariensis]|uniref:RING-type E3 ubiquitin transferase n=1 Tax=Volvox carteri f. nagariensis TaxID=3068 RepID=D8U304_VOLCA|nr:uncharacterized protein VOLCADRAFT_93769 [Volvox carteri f. nagariensis]EFJ45896.1 hypothetical protein VOLCADRAFT_93769 [Volvox carteri f. nagariensis]|eukprot:XP_002952974.1 hypothetical protein VOLCADRAFT_93769 [Volvox carteri f. nagariensis]
MASQQLLRTLDALMLLLLLACCSTDASMLRRLFSTQLQDSSATATSRDSSHAKAGARELHSTASSATDLSRHLMDVSSSPPSPLPAAPPWELELAPYMADLFPPRNPNSTLLRGPPRLAGVFKGKIFLASCLGHNMRVLLRDTLSSERGVIILRFPADQNSAGSGASMYDSRGGGGSAGGGSQRQLIPGGLQGLEGELVIRNGDSITDRDLRFRLRGTFVAAAGTVHAVLEPQLPLVLKEEVENGGGGAGGGDDWRQQQQQQHQAGLAVTKVAAAGGEGKAGPAAAVMAAAGGGGGGGGSAAAAAAAAGARGSGGGAQSSSGYREALRTAARNLVILGPAWHRTLVRHQPPAPPSPPPPHGSGGGGQRRQAVAEGESSPPSPPRPPLELALLQACELRADFRVYYKGDPDATSHVQFLRLDEPPSPPRQLKPSAAAGVTSGVDGDVNPAAATVVRQLRHLTADTEIYHSTQMQLHADATASAVAGGGGGGGGGGAAPAGAAVPAEDVVYGIPPGMDPMDPDLELVGVVMSPNCEFAVHFNASSVHLERYYRQAVRYSVLVAAVTIAQILLSVSQAEAASTPSAAARMSLYSVTMQAILDAYQCLLHLTGALVVDALFAAFASIAFLQFLLFAVFEMRQTLLVFRAQRTNGTGDGGDFWSVRRAMSAVYFRFYGLLLLAAGVVVVVVVVVVVAVLVVVLVVVVVVVVGYAVHDADAHADMGGVWVDAGGSMVSLLFMFQFRSQLALLVLVLHSWWVPQLVYSATSDTRPPYMAGYVWGMSALRWLAEVKA